MFNSSNSLTGSTAYSSNQPTKRKLDNMSKYLEPAPHSSSSSSSSKGSNSRSKVQGLVLYILSLYVKLKYKDTMNPIYGYPYYPTHTILPMLSIYLSIYSIYF